MADLEDEMVILRREKKELLLKIDLIEDRIIAIREEKRKKKESEHRFSVTDVDLDDD